VQNASHAPYNGITIVLDAGHGGVDGGVVGGNGAKEADINLSITKALKSILESRGYRVVLTRKNANGLYGLAKKGKRKLKDMNARREIIERTSPNLVVSIHQNSYPQKTQTGPQVFYSIGGDNKIASVLQGVLNTHLQNGNRVAKKGDYYILNCTKYDSVLVECGFLTTPSEERLLVQSAYQEKVAYGIFSGINKVFFVS